MPVVGVSAFVLGVLVVAFFWDGGVLVFWFCSRFVCLAVGVGSFCFVFWAVLAGISTAMS